MKWLFDVFQLLMILAFVTAAAVNKFDYSQFFGMLYCVTMLAEIKYGERRRKMIKLKDGTYGYGRAGEPKP